MQTSGAHEWRTATGYEKKVFASLDGFFGAQSRHIVLAGYKVTEVTENAVKLDRAAPAPFDGDTIPIEVGVIATGSSYAIPMRPLSAKLSEAQEGLRKMQGEIKSAKHIVVVGGGPVGVEFAGEVLEQHPGKKITLVHMGDSLLTGYRAPLGKKLFDQLRSRKVDVRLNTSVDLTKEDIEQSNRLASEDIHIKLSDGSSLTTDFLFLGTGAKPNTAVVPSDALDKASPARIDVNASTLRLKHPSLSKKWFALGDATNAPGAKTFVSVKAQSPIVAAQVKALLGSTKSTKVYKEPGQLIVVVRRRERMERGGGVSCSRCLPTAARQERRRFADDVPRLVSLACARESSSLTPLLLSQR